MIPIGISSKEAKTDIKIHPIVLLIDLYWSISSTSFCSSIFFIFQSKFLTYVFFSNTFKVILYFKLSRDFRISQLIVLLNFQTNCKNNNNNKKKNKSKKQKNKELMFFFKNVWYFRILKSSILTANDRIDFLAFLVTYLNLSLILTSLAI